MSARLIGRYFGDCSTGRRAKWQLTHDYASIVHWMLGASAIATAEEKRSTFDF